MKIKLFSTIVDSVRKLLDTIRAGIDDVHTSGEEKAEANRKLAEIEQAVYSEVAALQGSFLEAQSKLIETEATGESWLQRSWRPITMLVFLVMLIAWWFGIATVRVTDDILMQVFDLLKIGIGGYIASRGVEKVADKVAPIFRERPAGRSETTNGTEDDESPAPLRDRPVVDASELRKLPAKPPMFRFD